MFPRRKRLSSKSTEINAFEQCDRKRNNRHFGFSILVFTGLVEISKTKTRDNNICPTVYRIEYRNEHDKHNRFPTRKSVAVVASTNSSICECKYQLFNSV